MISYVNGYLCTSSCDVAKAKHGVDPHPKTSDPQNAAKSDGTTKGAATADNPAVIFGGSLSARSPSPTAASANVVQSSAATNGQTPRQTVDILV